MEKSRRQYTKEFKISLLREFESGKNIAQLSRENNLYPTLISRWYREYQDNPDCAFSENGKIPKKLRRLQNLFISFRNKKLLPSVAVT